MQDWVLEETVALIMDYALRSGLEADVPQVDLSPLEDIFPIGYHDLSSIGAKGLILPPRLGWPAFPGNTARVVIDRGVKRLEERLVYAHEIGHGICRHVGAALTGDPVQWAKTEREAWEVAAVLLIPGEVMLAWKERSTVAAMCRVPEWLLDFRLPPGPMPRRAMFGGLCEMPVF